MASGSRPGASALLGRERERARLERLLTAGTPHTVVHGLYGVGKTRLVREVVEGLGDVRAAWLGPGTPGGAVTDADLVVVDEATPADEVAAAGVATTNGQVVAAGGAAVLTIRCDHLPRDDDELRAAATVRLDPLAADDVAALAEATLRAPIGAYTLVELVTHSDGHPLFVEELLDDARRRGVLRRDADGVFRLRGRFEVPGSVTAGLHRRVALVSTAARATLALLAMTGELPLRTITSVAAVAACRELEARHLVTIDRRRGRLRCVHPVLADTVVGSLDDEEFARHVTTITSLLHPTGLDPRRLASWVHRSPVALEPALVADAARRAADQLDMQAARELAAVATPGAARDDVPGLFTELTAVAPAAEAGRDGGAEADPQVVRAAATYGRSYAGLVAGDLGSAEAPLDRSRADLDVLRDTAAQVVALRLDFVHHHVRVSRGELATARHIAGRERAAALAARRTLASGVWAANLGHVARFQGELATAERALSDAHHELAAHDALGIRAQLVGHRAIVAAELGRRTEVAALHGRRDPGPAATVVTRLVLDHRVAAWLAALDRDTAAMHRHSAAAIAAARDGDQPLLAVFAAHTAVRLGLAGTVITHLEELTGEIEGTLAPALCQHARAVTGGDVDDLVGAAHDLAATGARLWAAECLVTAAERAGAGARERYRGLAALVRPTGSEGAWILGKVPLAAPLTAREHEVALLAAGGASNLDIAARLGSAPRTVGTQLRSVYRKLDIEGRHELPPLDAPRTDAAST